jgi:hypothetical protein
MIAVISEYIYQNLIISLFFYYHMCYDINIRNHGLSIMFHGLSARSDSVPILIMLTILRPSLDQREHERVQSLTQHGNTHHPLAIQHR